MEGYTRLKFKEKDNTIKAILINGPSHSGVPFKSPMRMRHNYSKDVKLATLIHELGHRLVINIARANKDFATSDKIRDQLQEVGIQLKDGKDGTTYSLSQ